MIEVSIYKAPRAEMTADHEFMQNNQIRIYHKQAMACKFALKTYKQL